MKKISVAAVAAVFVLSSCGITTNGTSGNDAANVLNGVLGSISNPNNIGNVLSSVLGIDKPSVNDIYGTWYYATPGVAFTSENTLAKAGGEVVASQIKDKLAGYYSSVGLKKSNTMFTFNKNNTFSGKVDGKSVSGTWTYDANNQKITLKTLLFTIPVYAKETSNGMSFLMESKKLLTVLQTAAALTGNSNLQAIGELSKNYDGVRMGFDMKK